MANMKVISKEAALANACPECIEFFSKHEKLKGMPSYISDSLECKKCKLQVDMMGDKIATIWRIE